MSKATRLLQILLMSAVAMHSAVPASAQTTGDRTAFRIDSAAAFSNALLEIFQTGFIRSDSQLLDLAEIHEIYRLRNYKAIWVTGKAMNSLAQQFRTFLGTLGDHGLNPKAYVTSSLEEVLQEVATSPSSTALLRAELLLTQAAVRSAFHLSSGRFDPDQIDNDIKFKRKNFSSQDFQRLNQVLSLAEFDADIFTSEFTPQNEMYLNLAAALADLKLAKKTARSYLQLPFPFAAMKPGLIHANVLKLRQALSDRGYKVTVNQELYDSELEEMVKTFQRENGMDVNSTLGARSEIFKSLNFSLDQRIKQVEINLEKLRWLPAQLEDRHIFVNLAFSEMNVVENGRSVLNMKAVTGRPQWRSPSMRDVLSSVIFNPTWTATDSIVSQMKLPAILKDISYLAKNRIRLIDRRTGEEISADSLDWQNEGRDIIRRVLFVQDPGPNNALGVVKFMLAQNRDDIYMHDTDEKSLFSKSMRQRSSGCIRLEKPLALANYLLKDTEFNEEKISSVLVKGTPDETYERNLRVSLTRERQIPVYLLYLTAERGENGRLRYAIDYYSQDARIAQAVAQAISTKESY